MTRDFDLSGGKRGGLDGSARDTLQKPPRGRSGRVTIFLVAMSIAVALALGIALIILADGRPRWGPPKHEVQVQTPEQLAEQAKRVRDAQRSAADAVRQAEAASADADRMLREAKESIARAREAAQGDSRDILFEAEDAIESAREQPREDWARD